MFDSVTDFNQRSIRNRIQNPERPTEVKAPDQFAQPYLFNLETDGVVTEAIAPGQMGRIEYRGSWWLAQSYSPLVLPVGAIVRVTSELALPLRVELIYIPFQN